MDNTKRVLAAFATFDKSFNPIVSKGQPLSVKSFFPLNKAYSYLHGRYPDHLLTEAFLVKQAGPPVPHGPLGLINSTPQLGRNGVAGVSKGKS